MRSYSIKNYLLSLFFKLFSFFCPKQKKPQSIDRIGIFSTTGLGDSLWASPALEVLKLKYPKSKITFLTSAVGKEALLYHPMIDETIVFSLFSFFALFKELKKKKFDAIIIFHASQRKIFALAKFLNPYYLIGTSGRSKDLDFIFSHLVPSHRDEHEIIRRLNLTQVLGCEMPLQPKIKIFIQEHERKEAAFFLKTHGINSDDTLVAIHPGSKDLFKRWPKEYYEKVLSQLDNKKEIKIIISGSWSEAQLVKSIAREFPQALPLYGQISLRCLMAIFEKLSLLITNDTGPMHIGFALEIPTIALFSPTHPIYCGPYHAKNAIIEYANRCCHPCLHKKCREPFCMRQISQEIVTKQALTILNC